MKNNLIDDYEIILVGNYVKNSNDKTPEIVKSLSLKHDKVISITEPKPTFGWLGWDVRMALERASGHFIALIDGDGQMPAEDIASCYLASEENNAEVTMTYRITRGDGLYRRTLSNLYNLFVKILFPKCCVKDLNSKPKVLKKDLIRTFDLDQMDGLLTRKSCYNPLKEMPKSWKSQRSF